MDLRQAIAGVGLALVALSGVAHAQDGRVTGVSVPAVSPEAEISWHERFTTSAGVVEKRGVRSLSDVGPSVAWAPPTARWGVTVDMTDRARTPAGPEDKAAIGAFYHFSPRFRVGGEISVRDAGAASAAPAPSREGEADSAGVRLESAFKF